MRLLYLLCALGLAAPLAPPEREGCARCTCARLLDAAPVYDGADAVFVGRVIAANQRPDTTRLDMPGFDAGSPYLLAVEEEFKGPGLAYLPVGTGGLCPFGMAVGRRYLIVAREATDSRGARGYYTTLCSGSAGVNERAEWIEQMRSYAASAR